MQTQENIGRDQILKELTTILEPWIFDNDNGLNENTNLLSKFGIDSVSVMQIVLGIEKKFNIRIEDHELDIQRCMPF